VDETKSPLPSQSSIVYNGVMFLVVFRSRRRADIDEAAYAADAARMEGLARAQPGLLSFKTYVAADGEVVSLSEWASEAAVHAWGCHPDHAAIRERGREAYYEDYTLFSCGEPRVRQFDRSEF
jgi:heme-degrading monooxygenase HmoA